MSENLTQMYVSELGTITYRVLSARFYFIPLVTSRYIKDDKIHISNSQSYILQTTTT
ncbi:MAG: hypothetical protein OXC46_07335 [Thaumarchaeota archaeon]|nr:hypothetical protein [Nitrososphaerota archaeon]